MTQSDIKHDLNKGEGLTVDFKKATDSLPVNLFETVCEFESPNNVSYSKNPHIAKFFVQLGQAEEFGISFRINFTFSELYSNSKPLTKERNLFVVKLPSQEERKNHLINLIAIRKES